MASTTSSFAELIKKQSAGRKRIIVCAAFASRWERRRAASLLAAFEVAAAFPVGDGGVEGAELNFGHVEVVDPDVVAESPFGETAFTPDRNGLGKGARDVGDIGGFVGVAAKLRGQLERALDPIETGGEHGGVGEIGIGVAARETILNAQATAVADDPKAASSIVVRPDDVDGRPGGDGVALVGVDVA